MSASGPARTAGRGTTTELLCACGAPGPVRVVDPDGGHSMCALHAIALIGAGTVPVTLVVDTAVRK